MFIFIKPLTLVSFKNATSLSYLGRHLTFHLTKKEDKKVFDVRNVTHNYSYKTHSLLKRRVILCQFGALDRFCVPKNLDIKNTSYHVSADVHRKHFDV